MSGRVAFVSTGTRWLDLDGGGRIEVKQQLGYYEQKDLEGAGFKDIAVNGDALDGGDMADARPAIGIEWAAVEKKKLELYLVDWDGLDDPEGNPVPFSRQAVRSLDPAVATEMLLAINRMLEPPGAAKKGAPGDPPAPAPGGAD